MGEVDLCLNVGVLAHGKFVSFIGTRYCDVGGFYIAYIPIDRLWSKTR